MALDTFTTAYIEAALWSSTDENTSEGGEPIDANYGISDLAPGTLERMKADCASFQGQFWDEIHADAAQAGHDFWLTRNGHGAGFWDGDWPERVGEKLTDASHRCGEVNLYFGDDGMIYS